MLEPEPTPFSSLGNVAGQGPKPPGLLRASSARAAATGDGRSARLFWPGAPPLR